MSRTFLISANHVSDKYRLSNVRVVANDYNAAIRLRIRDNGEGVDECYFTAPNFGQGKSFSDPIRAIRSLLADNGCTSISVTEEIAETEESDELDLSNALLFADSNRGRYIPQHFAESVVRDYVKGVTDEQYATLAEGPDSEWYWETWDSVLNNAELTIPETGKAAYLHQDGDLWIVPKN